MLEKYKPTKFSEIVGNKLAVQTLDKWLLTWPALSPCVLVSGPCGVGKTLTIELLIQQKEYNVMEVNPDDERNDTYIQQHVKPFVKSKKNIWGKSNILVVNDVDVSNDHGFLGALCACIKETKIPIILTCNERYDPKIKTLATLCTDIKFFKPTSQEICRYIVEIVKKELNLNRLTPKQTQLIQTAAETAEGDVRNAIITAEFSLICGNVSTSTNKTKDKIKTNLFELTTEFMSQLTDYTDKVDLFNMEKELMPLMFYENYPHNIIKTKKPQETLHHLSFASSKMSDYDMFPYEYGSSSIIQATNVCHASSKINFTGYLGKMSTKTKKTNVTKDIENRLKLTVPVGHFRVDYMSYMLMVLYNLLNGGDVSAFVDKCLSYGFTKEDIQDNFPVILITEGPYSRCDYSTIDKKVKASITKIFTKQQQSQPLPTIPSKPPTKTKTQEPSAEKKTPAPRKTAAKKTTIQAPTTVTTPAQEPVKETITFTVTEPVAPPPFTPTPPPDPTTEPAPIKPATIFRKRTTKKVEADVVPSPPTPEPVPLSTAEPVPTTKTKVIRKSTKKPA